MSENYEDVLAQLQAFGLQVNNLDVGRLVRVPTQEDRGRSKSGWYSLHEIRLSGGSEVLVGAFGDWRTGGGSNKVSLKGRQLTDEEREEVKARAKADRREADRRRKATHARAARRARAVWDNLSPTGHCEYLVRKGVQGHGVRYSPQGNIAIPAMDAQSRMWGLQVVYSDGRNRDRDKDFFPAGMLKRGTFFLLGAPTWIILVSEGYATGASLHEATGYPVAVAWDAGNLLPVCEALHARYPQARILICGDDDYLAKCRSCGETTRVADAACEHCGEAHGKENTGLVRASNAATAVDGRWIVPRFDARGTRKLTDFNDLHQDEGLHVVRSQVEHAIEQAGWSDPAARHRCGQGGGDASKDTLRPIHSEAELLERYALIYGHGGAVFDHQEHQIVSLSDMRDACAARDVHRRWQEHPDRKIVRIHEVGFDPTGKDGLACNMWGGWPTTPRAGSCDRLLELLDYLCSKEQSNAPEISDWVLKWLAYPIQNPGAKMKTALVMHGPQGAGKNLFFEAVKSIYGDYGRVVDQQAIEDKFNDWASKKLFLIADEVVARQELFHTKNKLKILITSDEIRINPKNVGAYDERNRCNLVFLSNEAQPLVLEHWDRRYAVVWTPPELPPDIYTQVQKEIEAGGIEALHDYLLNLPLGDFSPYKHPPMTQSKEELIDMGLDSTERFFLHWFRGEIEGVEAMPCLSRDVYALYRQWCSSVGIPRSAPQHILLNKASKRPDVRKTVAWYLSENGTKKQATFLIPEKGPQSSPDGEMQMVWMGKCASQFRRQIQEWNNDGRAFE